MLIIRRLGQTCFLLSTLTGAHIMDSITVFGTGDRPQAALTPGLRAKPAPPDAFLSAMRGKATVIHAAARDLKLSPRTLPKMPTIYLLRYE